MTTNTITGYYEIGISHHHSGFGMYQLGEHNYSPELAWAALSDLEQAMRDGAVGELLPLDEALSNADFIAAGVDDLRGKIYGGDPEYLYAILSPDGQEITYAGVCSAEVSENYFA